MAISEPVTIGSLPHVAPILLFIISAVFGIRYSKRYLNEQQQNRVFNWLGILISGSIIVYHFYKISAGNYNFATDLPLFLCSFMALVIPVFTQTKRYWLYEVLLFWVIAGTTQGIITPDISEGFLSLDYVRYWIVHLGLVSIMLYATFVFGMRPTLKSVFKSFLALQVYAVVILILNWMLNANYSYLSRKPESASAMDFLAEWPYYILQIELIVLPYFFLIFLLFRERKTKQ
ncbi:TIGR02206 family membrane protein [Winogradskyella maritima]|nr:TIGR02206 family membrane protein [Winogradskyella maritima]